MALGGLLPLALAWDSCSARSSVSIERARIHCDRNRAHPTDGMCADTCCTHFGRAVGGWGQCEDIGVASVDLCQEILGADPKVRPRAWCGFWTGMHCMVKHSAAIMHIRCGSGGWADGSHWFMAGGGGVDTRRQTKPRYIVSYRAHL